jgi:hypothetical protein
MLAEAVMKRSQILWKTGIFNILVQIAFLAVFYVTGRDVTVNLWGARELLFDVGIVLIPCAI